MSLEQEVRDIVEVCRKDELGSIRVYAPHFLQIAPNPQTNLNFWCHPTQDMLGITGIHNHYVDFRSDIVLGCIKNFRYTVRPHKRGKYREYGISRTTDAIGKLQYAVTENGRASVKRHSAESYAAGETYSLAGSEVHSNEIDVPTITIMRIDRASEGTPEVFYAPVNEPYTTTIDMRKPHSPEQLTEAWQRIDSFLDLLSGFGVSGSI